MLRADLYLDLQRNSLWGLAPFGYLYGTQAGATQLHRKIHGSLRRLGPHRCEWDLMLMYPQLLRGAKEPGRDLDYFKSKGGSFEARSSKKPTLEAQLPV